MSDARRPDVRDRLLAAGRELTRATSPEMILPGVRAACEAAGVSASSFYWHYDDASAYWLDLLASASDHDPVRDFSARMQEALVDAAERIKADPTVAVQANASLAAMDAEFHATAGVDALRLQLALLGVAQDDGPLSEAIRALYRELYAVIRAFHVAGYEVLLDAWGRAPRDPFSFESISTTITAMADGMLVRSLFDDDSDLITLFEDAITALLASVTRRIEDTDDLPTFLDAHFRRDHSDVGIE